MGIRLRKRIKLAPGLHINLSKSGVSTSVGKPGATVNVGKDGVKSTVGIPGSGISYTHNHSKKTKQPKQAESSKNNHLPGWVTICAIIFVIWIIAKIV